MTNPKKEIVVVAILSILVAVQAFFATVAPSIDRSPTPAAAFSHANRTPNVARTLRPDGQTEKAELCNDWTFEDELGSLCPELWNPVFAVDRIYISPTAQTARLILKRAFRKLEDVYVPEAYDCDDNATELMTLLKKEALVEYREYPAALAIGWVGLRFDDRIQELRGMDFDADAYPFYHAMVIMRLKGGTWLLIEPLTHQYCELTGPIFEGCIAVGLLYF